MSRKQGRGDVGLVKEKRVIADEGEGGEDSRASAWSGSKKRKKIEKRPS